MVLCRGIPWESDRCMCATVLRPVTGLFVYVSTSLSDIACGAVLANGLEHEEDAVFDPR